MKSLDIDQEEGEKELSQLKFKSILDDENQDNDDEYNINVDKIQFLIPTSLSGAIIECRSRCFLLHIYLSCWWLMSIGIVLTC